MSDMKVNTPIGLTPVVRLIEDVCAHADIYQRCGMSPGHYIFNLDAGNGQTTLTSYISDMFMRRGIRHFGGLDLFLEYRLDGTMQQLKQVLCDIRACAVYTNEYEGVIAMDITDLATHINEAQTMIFLDEVKKIAAAATMIFYVPSVPSRNTAVLMKKLQNSLKDVAVVSLRPYEPEELSEIVKSLIEDSGVEMVRSAEMDDTVLHAVTANEVKTVKDAKRFAQELIKCADFSQFTPILSLEAMRQASDCLDTHREVR